MAYRGRGRGFGGRYRGGGYGHVDKFQLELFPEIDLPDVRKVKEEKNLYYCTIRLQKLWESSAYNYKGVDHVKEGSKSIDVERYSTNDSAKTKHKSLLSDYIKMTDDYVSAELAVRHQHVRKRVRWNQESDMLNFDIFEQLENKSETTTDKKEDDAEEEEDEKMEEEDDEFSDDGDYNQNADFDDDDDDFNMADDNDDEPMF